MDHECYDDLISVEGFVARKKYKISVNPET